MKKILLSLLLLIAGFGHAVIAQTTTIDILPDTHSTDSTAVLNNDLRLNQNAINTIGNYFNSNGYLQTSAGGTSANLSACTTGSLPYFSSLGVFSCFPDGASGYVLTAQGAGSAPIYALPLPDQTGNAGKVLTTNGASTTGVLSWGSSGLTFISATTFTNANPGPNITIDSTKQYYVRALFTTNQNDQWNIRFNADSGSNYRYVFNGLNTSATGYADSNNAGTSAISFGVMNGTVYPIEVDFYINIQSTSSTKPVIIQGKATSMSQSLTSKPGYQDIFGVWANSVNVTSFYLFSGGGGALFTGTIYLYEITTS